MKNHGEARGDAIRKIAGWKRRVELGGFIGSVPVRVVCGLSYNLSCYGVSWSGVGTMEWICWANYARLAGDWIFV